MGNYGLFQKRPSLKQQKISKIEPARPAFSPSSQNPDPTRARIFLARLHPLLLARERFLVNFLICLFIKVPFNGEQKKCHRYDQEIKILPS